jgi:hypothetical protein
VITTESFAAGAIISTHHTSLRVLGPPLQGPNWLAADGPGNDSDNHHRLGIVIVDGRSVISRLYAIDWKQIERGVFVLGRRAGCTVLLRLSKGSARHRGWPSRHGKRRSSRQHPGHNEAFHPAVPITLETVSGDMITIDLGGGQFAYYMHLQPGSLRVKAGDRVLPGQVLAGVGCSGDAREPHLHFEVTDSSKPLVGEGMPYVIDWYRRTGVSGTATEIRRRELPLNGSVVAFRGERGK